MRIKNTCASLLVLIGLLLLATTVMAGVEPFELPLYDYLPALQDSDTLVYPIKDRRGDPLTDKEPHPIDLKDPSNVTTEVEYDPETKRYIITEKIGNDFYRAPSYMTFEEYKEYQAKKAKQQYWQQRVEGESFDKQKPLIPEIQVKSKLFEGLFGGGSVDIRPQGSAELIFGYQISRTDNPSIPEKQRRVGTFDFDQKIQMNVIGSIGEKMKLNTKYNTEATFDFDNQMKLGYTGDEDDIIKVIEAGNVSLPLTGSLITGSQSLFGIKTQLQFGRLTVTSVFSQQRGKKEVVEIEGGAQKTEFKVGGDEYEANRHYFLAQYFRENYNQALSGLPVIRSGVNITRIEVWVTNIAANATENTRNIVASMDLGERQPFNNSLIPQPGVFPDNQANSLYGTLTNTPGARQISQISAVMNNIGLESAVDYVDLENAKMLNPNEFTFHPQLGYISLNQSLNQDQVLAVAFQFTVNNQTFQVGEFSTDGVSPPQSLFVKMLKSTILNVKLPIWDLMMKNVYSIGAFQLNKEDFDLQIFYNDPATGVLKAYLPEGAFSDQLLIRVLNLDKLNNNLDPQPDGQFDFIDGLTVYQSNGRVFIPLVEPFGSDLRAKFQNPAIADKFVFQELYDSTKFAAQQIPSKNRYVLAGSYKSASGSEIAVGGFNLPQGSVTVTAGGQVLQENVDYTVDYALGRVKIINEGILNSGQPIQVSTESNSLFNIQSKTLIGSHFDYRFSKDFSLAATIMNLTERPLTQKINIGDEPISNTIWGLNGNYRTDSRLLTRMVDRIPLIDTKAPSAITVSGEVAHLIPGHSRAIGKDGVSYIDDFEGSETPIDIKNARAWVLASTPQGQPGLFPEGDLVNNLAYGYNRAKLGWYTVDPLFTRNNNLTPDHIKKDEDERSNHFVREVLETEIFPNKQLSSNQPGNLPMLNLAYYPSEKGPYNFDVFPSAVSSGMSNNGNLEDPNTRWGGVMRKLETNDFQAANIEFIEFWVLDPFINGDGSVRDFKGGDLYFNLGNVSEDILADGRKSFENGLPVDDDASVLDSTTWGVVPVTQALVNAFDTDPKNRPKQDVGLDGLSSAEEVEYFKPYLDSLASKFGANSSVWRTISDDPSGDDYRYYRDDVHDANSVGVLDRYKKYNGLEGNSPTDEQSAEINSAGYPTSATTIPDVEDINRDNTVNKTESYYQYRVSLRPEDMVKGENFITDVVTVTPDNLPNGNTTPIKYYQFRIPVRNPEKVVNDIQGFNSIRFIRMFLKNFNEEVFLRFARLELVRSEWRKFDGELPSFSEEESNDDPNAIFDVTTVNIEENGTRQPINYVLPPEIQREVDPSTPNLRQLNEQSLVLRVCDLSDGSAKAVYRNVDFDVRAYKRLKMFVHAESFGNEFNTRSRDVTVFLRLGSDFTDNYYEYEIPLVPTDWGDNTEAAIWRDENAFDFAFEVLQKAKLDRNLAGKPTNIRHAVPVNGNTVYVKGNPVLSDIKTVMIGVRNPARFEKNNPRTDDDGMSKCAEVWVNELRLTDFDQAGGWAANTRISAKLADFGTLNLAGSKKTFGFGSIEKKVSERSRENLTQYDASTSLELGKFLGEKSGVSIPMYYGISEGLSKPQFNPLNPDILLKTSLDELETEAERDSARHHSEAYTKRRSINFTNVRKTKTGGKPHFYDIENLAATYAYTETFQRNVNTEFNTEKNYRGSLTYNFAPKAKNVQPLKRGNKLSKTILGSYDNKIENIQTELDSAKKEDAKAPNVSELKQELEEVKEKKAKTKKTFDKLGRSKYLAPIRDFNFYYMPRQISMRTGMERNYREQLLRNTSLVADFEIDPTFDKRFTWDRNYDIKYDLTKSIKMEFAANANARIDEPAGRVDKRFEDQYAHWKDSVLDNISDGGRLTDYRHNFNASYNVPLNKFPLTDWINLNASYSAMYNWQAASLAADSLGNLIQNNASKQLNGKLTMKKFYDKFKFLEKLSKTASKEKKKKDPSDTTKTKEPPDFDIVKGIGKIVTSLKSIDFNFSQDDGTILPGFLPVPDYIGVTQRNNIFAPGLGFVFGQQNDWGNNDTLTFAEFAGRRGWISNDTLINTPFTTTSTQKITVRATMEPLRDLRIELNAFRNEALSHTEIFRADASGEFQSFSPLDQGNFSMSFNTWSTAFKKDNDRHVSEVFQQFKNNRAVISRRLGADNPNSVGLDSTQIFAEGYGPGSQDVLIPAFIAAYTGKNAASVALKNRPSIPNPNWRITYNGLTKLELFKKFFKRFSVSHSYKSSYNINSFISNLNHKKKNGGASVLDINENFIPELQINAVTIQEQFGPFLKLDMTWKNNIISNFEITKSRSLTMNFSNNQLTERKESGIIVGAGYRLEEFEFPLKVGGKPIKSPLNLKADISIMNNKTVLRKVDEDFNQPSAGMRLIGIKLTADYALSDRFNIRAFFDRNASRPVLSLPFPRADTKFGVSIRFTLAQ